MATTVSQPMDDEDDIQQDESAKNEHTGEESEDDGDPLEDREDLQKILYSLYLKCCEEDRFPRICEIMDIQQAHDYWRGLQYRWWSRSGECWNFPNENNGLQTSPEDGDDMPRFEFCTNVYQAFGLSLIAAMSQAPPRTRWFPDDAEEPEDVTTAEGNSKLAKIIERWNPIQIQLQDEIYHLWTGGIVAGWTRYISDDKFGSEDVEDLAAEEAGTGDEVRCAKCGFSSPAEDVNIPGPCPRCGQPLTDDNIAPSQTASVPASTGKQEVPKGRQINTIKGAMNLKRNQYAQEQSEYLYFSFEEEIHYAKLRAAYPDKADKIKPGQGTGEDNGFERNARLAVMQGTNLSQQTGENQSVLTTFARVWFRPDAFWSDAVPEDKREELLDIFPSGCKVYFAGSTYCESEEQSMDDCWNVQHAMPGTGNHRPALGSSMISVQDRFNTWSNIQAETYEYGIPVTYRAADTWDAEASEEQRAEPGAEIDIALAPTTDIRTRIMQLRNDSASPDMLEGMNSLMGPVGQFLTGAFPALLGAGAAQGAAGDTASGYKMQMDQALGRCGISYVRLKQFHADMQTLACKDFCSHASGKVSMSVVSKSGDFESESVDVSALKGNAQSYPEGDENFPEMWNQQRAIFMQIMDSAQGAALMSDPTNAETAVKLIGIPNLVLPGADAKRKVLRVIGQLTKPQPQAEAIPGAQPMPPNVAGLIDPVLDKPRAPAMAQAANDWLISEAGVKCEKENPTGFAAVRQYTISLMGIVTPPQPVPPKTSVSIALKGQDITPQGIQAALAEYGINLSADDFLAAAALKGAEKSGPPQGSPALPPNGGNQVVNGPGASNG